MFWTLTKKQFRECFRSFYVSNKTGKASSKASRIGRGLLLGMLLLFLCGAFYGLSSTMGTLLHTPFRWLYFALTGILSMVLGIFGSVFNTYAMLYLSRDNELLLAMPIPPRMILGSRMTLAYGLSALYSGIVWLPGMLYVWINDFPGAWMIVIHLVLYLVLALFVMVMTCFLGWVVALAASRMRNRSMVVTVLSAVFLISYYYLSTKFTDFIEMLIFNAAGVSEGIRTWGNLLYQLGQAADGSISSMMLFSGITLLLFSLCFWLMERSFVNIVTKPQTAGTVKSGVTVRSSSVSRALLKRELRRFTSSSTYMLNCGLGVLLMVMLAVMALLKGDVVLQYLDGVRLMMPDLAQAITLLPLLAVALLGGMNCVSTPSISLEGKNLWILRSMPVTGKMVLRAKLLFHVLVTLPVAEAAALLLGIRFGVEAGLLIECMLLIGQMVYFTGLLGLILNLLHPNFTWTNETVVIKQSVNVLLVMLAGIAVPFLIAAACFLLSDYAELIQILSSAVLVMVLLTASMQRWLDNRGAKLFDAL